MDNRLYFLSEQYFADFPDDMLEINKRVDGSLHPRPCFLAFQDSDIPEIFWVVPLSSKVEKYRKKAEEEADKYGEAIKVVIGKVLGREMAFLIQNMCPTIKTYMESYVNKNGEPICVSEKFSAEVIRKAHSALDKARHGARIIYPDIFKIYDGLRRKLGSVNGNMD